jgi:hypothetical protein
MVTLAIDYVGSRIAVTAQWFMSGDGIGYVGNIPGVQRCIIGRFQWTLD